MFASPTPQRKAYALKDPHSWWIRLPETGDIPPNRRSLSVTRHPDNSTDCLFYSGGFSDTDWNSFPVYRFCMNDTDEEDDANVWTQYDTVGDELAGRVGHISGIYNDTLYVLGGLMYNKNAFGVEDEVYVHSTPLKSDQEEDAPKTVQWTTTQPTIQGGHFLPRGEIAGGLWTDSEGNPCLIIHGGLHIRSQTRNSPPIRSGSPGIQSNVPLGDVWAYYFHNDTLVGLSDALHPPNPISRTSHAGCITPRNELVIYGGMALNLDTWTGMQWDMLGDVWLFDLVNHTWTEIPLYPPLLRSYHTLVCNDQDIIAFGGYRTTETVAGEPIAFVFSDALKLTLPTYNDTVLTSSNSPVSSWLKAQYPKPDTADDEDKDTISWTTQAYTEGITHRLEHTAALIHDDMYIWGGRFKTVSQIEGMWKLDVSDQHVTWVIAEPDGLDAYQAEMQTMHLLVAIMLFMAVLFTALYGTLRRQVENAAQNAAMNGNGANGTPMTTAGFLRRSYRGLSPSRIDLLPVCIFQKGGDFPTSSSSGRQLHPLQIEDDAIPQQQQTPEDDEEPLCPICLIEYEDGDEIRTLLPCHHDFHKNCVDSWLESNASCPACRGDIVIPEDTTASSGSSHSSNGNSSHSNLFAMFIRQSLWSQFVVGANGNSTHGATSTDLGVSDDIIPSTNDLELTPESSTDRNGSTIAPTASTATLMSYSISPPYTSNSQEEDDELVDLPYNNSLEEEDVPAQQQAQRHHRMNIGLRSSASPDSEMVTLRNPLRQSDHNLEGAIV